MERRTSPRIPLDTPCLLTLVTKGKDMYSAMLVDVGSGGLQLALPPDSGEDAVAAGIEVELRNVPPPFTLLLEGATGQIAWVGQRCCGVRFDKLLTIDSAHLTHLVTL